MDSKLQFYRTYLKSVLYCYINISGLVEKSIDGAILVLIISPRCDSLWRCYNDDNTTLSEVGWNIYTRKETDTWTDDSL